MCYPRLTVKVFVSPTVKATGYWSNHRSSSSRTFSATGASSGTQSVVWSPRETQDTLATCPLLRGDDLTSSGWWGCLLCLSYILHVFLSYVIVGRARLYSSNEILNPSKSWEATDSCMPRIAGLGMSLRMIRCLYVEKSNYDKCILLCIYIYTNSIMLSLRILD